MAACDAAWKHHGHSFSCLLNRRIFEPIQISLRHSKVSSNSNGGGAAGPGRPPRRPARGGHRRSPSGAGPAGSGRGEELLLKVRRGFCWLEWESRCERKPTQMTNAYSGKGWAGLLLLTRPAVAHV